jgi:hypothetical protein
VRGAGEPVHVTDLRDEDRGQHRPDPRHRLHRGESRIAGQRDPQRPADRVDLEVDGVN